MFVTEVNSHRDHIIELDKTGTHLKYFSQKQDVVLIKNLLLSVQGRWEKLVQRSVERGRLLDDARKRAKQVWFCAFLYQIWNRHCFTAVWAFYYHWKALEIEYEAWGPFSVPWAWKLNRLNIYQGSAINQVKLYLFKKCFSLCLFLFHSLVPWILE